MDAEYAAKCAAHLRPAALAAPVASRPARCSMEDGYQSDEDNTSILKMWPPKSSPRKQTRWLNDLDSPPPPLQPQQPQRLHQRPPRPLGGSSISREEEELMGRSQDSRSELERWMVHFRGQSGLLRPDPIRGDNLLMKKCCQKVQLSDDQHSHPSTNPWKRKQIEILALAKVISESQPQLLTSRNFEVSPLVQ